MKNKVILVGAINEGNIPTCGETMKNQLFVKRFNELFDKVITVDTLNWKKRPWILIRLFCVLLFNRDAKVIISASRAASYLISFLYYIPLNKQVYFWVVGGNFADAVKTGKYNLKALSSLKYILVQGKCMVKDLSSNGLENVMYVPNSKPITFTPSITPKEANKPYRFVFLSRVHPSKGIKEIVEATKQLNEMGLQNKFTVDFYGKIEHGYEAEFNTAIASCSNVTYKGFLNLMDNRGYENLSTYDVMLFPTYWYGEGFPGIVIDANMAGVPIIASDWNMNKEVIVEGQTGYIIPINDSAALKEKMKLFIDGQIDLLSMKQCCIDYIQKFDYRNVLSVDLMNNIGLLK